MDHQDIYINYEDIWHKMYEKAVMKVGVLFFIFFNEALYGILGLTPLQVVNQEWDNLTETEHKTYKKNKALINHKRWKDLDITAHNFLFRLVCKCLQNINKGINPYLKEYIETIVILRNNISHDKIVSLKTIHCVNKPKISFNAKVLKDELRELINLYKDIFCDIKKYFHLHGQSSPVKEENDIVNLLNFLDKSADTPNFLVKNIEQFEASIQKNISELDIATQDMKKSSDDIKQSSDDIKQSRDDIKQNNKDMGNMILELNSKLLEFGIITEQRKRNRDEIQLDQKINKQAETQTDISKHNSMQTQTYSPQLYIQQFGNVKHNTIQNSNNILEVITEVIRNKKQQCGTNYQGIQMSLQQVEDIVEILQYNIQQQSNIDEIRDINSVNIQHNISETINQLWNHFKNLLLHFYTLTESKQHAKQHAKQFANFKLLRSFDEVVNPNLHYLFTNLIMEDKHMNETLKEYLFRQSTPPSNGYLRKLFNRGQLRMIETNPSCDRFDVSLYYASFPLIAQQNLHLKTCPMIVNRMMDKLKMIKNIRNEMCHNLLMLSKAKIDCSINELTLLLSDILDLVGSNFGCRADMDTRRTIMLSQMDNIKQNKNGWYPQKKMGGIKSLMICGSIAYIAVYIMEWLIQK